MPVYTHFTFLEVLVHLLVVSDCAQNYESPTDDDLRKKLVICFFRIIPYNLSAHKLFYIKLVKSLNEY